MNRILTKKEAPNKMLNEKKKPQKEQRQQDLYFTKNKNYTHTHKDT